VTKFLRTVSTRRLLALIVALITAIAAGAAIAIAASGTGPVPPKRPLAGAIHSALGARSVPGITARISFTNHLIGSSNIQGSDPILTGATGRLWLSTTDHRLRLELQSNNGDAQVVVNNGSFWIYDPSANTVYKGKLPADRGERAAADASHHQGMPSVAEIQRAINRLASHVDLSGAIPSDVAGHAAYTVSVSPKHDGGLLGATQMAWDAVRGIPLRFAIYAHGNSAPVLELKATDISYGPVPASDFAAAPPPGAKVVSVKAPAASAHKMTGRRAKQQHSVSGAAAVARHVHFKLNAPRKLVGLPRRSVTLLDWQGSPAALITYGQNLGGLAVLEQTAQPKQASTSSGDHRGLSLPTVSINGATAQELDTALGTMLRFTRGGVTYTVVGSVQPVAAEQAARRL
jgi:outer membrane lipoprotein-sorting protein